MEIRKKIPAGQFSFPNCNYVIIDTDAGGDDAQAILLAISQAKRTNKTILGITCIDGNAAIDDVARNVLITTTIAEAQIPIYKGSRMSITGPTHKDFYFSTDGFGLKQRQYIQKLKAEKRWKPSLIKEQGAIQFLVQSVNKYPGDIAIIAIGPLTNLALAYHCDNSFAEKVGFISLMGGSTSAFGIRQFFSAQFNFFLDAEAARIVIQVFPKVCINSFDLSFDLGTKKTLSLFTDDSRPKAKLVHDIHSVILETHRPSLCDPLACIPVFHPEVAESIYKFYGKVEIAGQRTRGYLCTDWFTEEIEGKQKLMAIADINLQEFMKRINDSYN